MKARGINQRWVVLIAAVTLSQFSFTAFPQGRGNGGSGEQWIPTWTAAPQSPRPALIRATQNSAASPAAAGPGAPPILSLNDQTARMTVHTTIGGRRVRIQLSNIYGTATLNVGATHIAIREKESAIVPGSDRALLFSGKASFSIPPGAVVISDPVDLKVAPLSDLAVSVYIPGDSGPATLHSVGLHTTYLSRQGDATGQREIDDGATSLSWYWLSDVEVLAPADAAAIVTFGDSITDGTRSTPNTDSSWPSFLARRLMANSAMSHIAVLNEGISGNRVLQDGMGSPGLARFDRDVLMQPGVKWVTILQGINDIGAGIGEAFILGAREATLNPTPDDLISAYLQMIGKAHSHGIKIIGCTLIPFEGAVYYRESGDMVRQAVNQWIRTSGAFDAIIDFDAVIRSPENPNKFRPEFDSGDHLHPNDTGYKAMADTLDLSIFKQKAMPASPHPR